jgi:hypothetical protein
MISVKLPIKLCYLACIPINHNSILILGGWNGVTCATGGIFRLNKSIQNNHSIIEFPAKKLKIGDVFRNGITPIGIEPNKLAI